MKIDWKKSVIILSGGFDPIHKGHMRMFREASWLGHQVVVGLNSDEWLTRKKKTSIILSSYNLSNFKKFNG